MWRNEIWEKKLPNAGGGQRTKSAQVQHGRKYMKTRRQTCFFPPQTVGPSSGWQTAKRCPKMWKKQSSCSTCAVKWVRQDHVQGCVSTWACDSPERRPSDTRRYHKPSVLKKINNDDNSSAKVMERMIHMLTVIFAEPFEPGHRFQGLKKSWFQNYKYTNISAICSRTPLLFNYHFNIISRFTTCFEYYFLLFVNKLCSMKKKSFLTRHFKITTFGAVKLLEFIITSKTCRTGQFQMRGQQGYVHAVVYIQ